VCGLATAIVTRAFDVPLPREDAATYVKVEARKRTFVTPVVTPDSPDNLDPVYSSAFHIPLSVGTRKEEKKLDDAEQVADRRSNLKRRQSISGIPMKLRAANENKDIVFTLMNDNSSRGHAPTKLGSFTVTHDSLLRAHNHTITEVRPIGEDGASLGFRVRLSGMQSKEEKSCQNQSDELPPPVSAEDPFVQTTTEPSFASKKQTLRVTAMNGRGFNVETRNLLIGTANDIQDVYCCVRLLKPSQQQQPLDSKSRCWRTSTIKDDTMPQWNETETFVTTDTARDVIRVDAYNENQSKENEYLGGTEYPVNKLLRKRLMEMELRIDEKPTGSFVTLKGVAVPGAPESQPSLQTIGGGGDVHFGRRKSIRQKIHIGRKSFLGATTDTPSESRKSFKTAVSLQILQNKFKASLPPSGEGKLTEAGG